MNDFAILGRLLVKVKAAHYVVLAAATHDLDMVA